MLGSVLRRTWNTATDLLYPPQCLLCGRSVSDRLQRLCSPCATLWAADTCASACLRCGEPTGTEYDTDKLGCAACRNANLPVAGVIRVGVYGQALGPLIARFKFSGDHAVGRALAGALADRLENATWRAEIHAVVPVPSSWQRRITRRVHTPTELAHVVARRIGKPVVPVLRRIGNPRPQTGLDASRRRANVRGTFGLRPGLALTGGTFLLIDDVITVRATSFECAGILRGNGAETVYVAVLAKTSLSPR